jgi:hypothetical protein
MKYEIEKVGEPGKLYLEADDLVGVAPAKDGTHAVELAVRYRKPYQADSSFEWQGAGSKELKLRLVARQAMEIVQQERGRKSAFCTDCYDYGKAEQPPKDCLRCQLLAACQKAGQGDYRKIRPVKSVGKPGVGYGIGMLLLVLLWWWTLCQWANATTRTDVLEQQLQSCNQVKPS